MILFCNNEIGNPTVRTIHVNPNDLALKHTTLTQLGRIPKSSWFSLLRTCLKKNLKYSHLLRRRFINRKSTSYNKDRAHCTTSDNTVLVSSYACSDYLQACSVFKNPVIKKSSAVCMGSENTKISSLHCHLCTHYTSCESVILIMCGR